MSRQDGNAPTYAALARQVLAEAKGRLIMLRANPGEGGTLLARAIHAAMPQVSREALIQIGMAYGAARLSCGDTVPYRAPHYSASPAAMGGRTLYPSGHQVPGEVALARNGVLVLHDAHEFGRDSIEILATAYRRKRAPQTVAIAPRTCRDLVKKRLARLYGSIDVYEVRVAARLAEQVVAGPDDARLETRAVVASQEAAVREAGARLCKDELLDWVVEQDQEILMLRVRLGEYPGAAS